MQTLAEAEREKYTKIWRDHPIYREISPGLDCVKFFYDVLHPRRGATLIDIGCGAGVAGLEFERRGLNVTWLDFTTAGLEDDVPRGKFIDVDLWSRWPSINKYGWDYGYCCDVMEHIPTEFVALVIDRILTSCRTTWFQIAFLPDSHGALVGKPLHLTVQPFRWWLERLRMLGDVVEARDTCGRGVFVVKR